MSDYEVHVQYHHTLLQVCDDTAAQIDEYDIEFSTQFSWSRCSLNWQPQFQAPATRPPQPPVHRTPPGRHQMLGGHGLGVSWDLYNFKWWQHKGKEGKEFEMKLK